MVKFAKWFIKGFVYMVPRIWRRFDESFGDHVICKVICGIILSITMAIEAPFTALYMVMLYYTDQETAELMWTDEETE